MSGPVHCVAADHAANHAAMVIISIKPKGRQRAR
jgi:hypothetical protein